MENLTVDVQTFLKKFFGPGNEVRWEQVSGGLHNSQAAEDLASWIEDLNGFKRPVLLPRKRKGGMVQWYALAFSTQQARALREDLMAFVGPTWTLFSGQTSILDPCDPVEAAILELTGQTTYRIDIPFQDHVADVRKNLMQMRNMWKQRPLRGRSTVRPIGRVIRDFELALQSGALDLADRFIVELRSGGKLSAQNLVFLKVRRLAAAGAWKELLALPEVLTLLQIRRPTLVTQALLEGIYAEFLAPMEKEGKPREALELFRNEILPRWSPLFRARGAIRSPDALKAFLLYAAAATPPRVELRDAVLAEYTVDGDGRSYVEALAALVIEPKFGALTPLEMARQAFFNHDFDTAYVHLLESAPGRETLQLLLTTALELGTLDSARCVLDRVHTAPEEERDAVLSLRTCQRDLAELQKLSGIEVSPAATEEEIPTGWLEWIRRVVQGPWPAAIELAERGRLEWDLSVLQNNSDQISEFRMLLEQGASASIDSVRYSLPHLLAALMSLERSTSVFKPLYLSLLTILALDEGIGSESFDVMQDLVRAIIQGDHTTKDYQEAVECLQCAWENIQSARLLDDALDMLDLLIDLPCKNLAIRLEFWLAVTKTIQHNIRRIEVSQWAFYRILSQELKKSENADALYTTWVQQQNACLEDANKESLAIPNLKGKTIALYTLTESAARRSQRFLEYAFPGVRIQLSSDHVATESLLSMARTADYFIVATRSAKHAATNYIRDNRPRSLPLLYAAGKGTASVLRAMFDYLASKR